MNATASSPSSPSTPAGNEQATSLSRRQAADAEELRPLRGVTIGSASQASKTASAECIEQPAIPRSVTWPQVRPPRNLRSLVSELPISEADDEDPFVLPHDKSMSSVSDVISNTLLLVTLPLRMAVSAVSVPLRTRVLGPKRPTWNSPLELATSMMRNLIRSAPRNLSLIRAAADTPVPSFLLPDGVLLAADALHHDGHTIPAEWVWPSDATPSLCTLNCWGSVSTWVPNKRRRRWYGPFQTIDPITQNDEFREKALGGEHVVLYFHGGAFCLCNAGSHRRLVSELAGTARCLVCSVEYRRPPEVSHAAALEDCLASYVSLLQLGVPATRIYFAGDSAGGNLAAGLLCMIRDGAGAAKGVPLPAGGILLSPWVDLSETCMADDGCMKGARGRSSLVVNTNFDYLPLDLILMFTEMTLGKDQDPHDPYVSPAFAELTGLPPLLVMGGDCEVLRDQIKAYGEKAERANPASKLIIYKDMVHAFLIFSFCHKTPTAGFQDIADFMKRTQTASAGTI